MGSEATCYQREQRSIPLPLPVCLESTTHPLPRGGTDFIALGWRDSDKLKCVGQRKTLWQQAHFFAELNGLRPSFGAQFVEKAARVGFDRVFANEQLLSNFTIA